MRLARVIGTVVATVRYEGLEGVKFLVIQPLDKELEPKGEPVVAADGVHMAGPGELVYYVSSREAGETVLVLDEGNSARQMLSAPDAPVRAVVAGIVDEVTR
jgi:ethanolamine utilization protein EutN